MLVVALFLLPAFIAAGFFFVGQKQGEVFFAANSRIVRQFSHPGLPFHCGLYVASWALLPAFGLAILWLVGQHQLLIFWLEAELDGQPNPSLALYQVQALAASGAQEGAFSALAALHGARVATGHWLALLFASLCSFAGGWLCLHYLHPQTRTRDALESLLRFAMLLAGLTAILITLGIFLSMLVESWRFFQLVPLTEFLFGLHWSPQTALRADQVAASGSFGAVPLFAGTLLISAIALLVAGPAGLLAAIYTAEFASPQARRRIKPVLELLAGVPTVVYGFFAALWLAPLIRQSGEAMGLNAASESALAAGLVMGLMILPFISSLSDDCFKSLPNSIREGAYALGATRSEAVLGVLLPAAMPSIASAFLLAISRAIGETMIVVMAAGLAANLTANPFAAATTVTVQIVTLLTGDQEFDSAKTLAAFALGMTLFLITLALNVLAFRLMQHYRRQQAGL